MGFLLFQLPLYDNLFMQICKKKACCFLQHTLGYIFCKWRFYFDATAQSLGIIIWCSTLLPNVHFNLLDYPNFTNFVKELKSCLKGAKRSVPIISETLLRYLWIYTDFVGLWDKKLHYGVLWCTTAKNFVVLLLDFGIFVAPKIHVIPNNLVRILNLSFT